MNEFTFIKPPPTVGFYVINNSFQIAFVTKPNWFHRFMTRVLLGWVWRNA